jgi:quinol monooxygenase YgiN
LPARVGIADDASEPDRKETPMSRLMLVVEFEVKPERRQQFIDLMRGHAQRSRSEDGCAQFDVLVPGNDERHVLLVEGWRDAAALDVHSKGPMLAQTRETYKDWIVDRKITRCMSAD